MAINSKSLIVILGLLSIASAADVDPNEQPNELNLKPTTPSSLTEDTTGTAPGSSSTTLYDTVSPSAFTSTTMAPQNYDKRPVNNDAKPVYTLEEEETDNNNNNNSPMPFFGPSPFNRSPFMNMFGNIFEDMNRHRQMMDRQFGDLEQQAAEGQQISYFSRNGVSYVKTCTVKRVDNNRP